MKNRQSTNFITEQKWFNLKRKSESRRYQPTNGKIFSILACNLYLDLQFYN